MLGGSVLVVGQKQTGHGKFEGNSSGAGRFSSENQ
jgi:hypothetical protein